MKMYKIILTIALMVFLIGCDIEHEADYIELGISSKAVEPSVLWELNNISEFNIIYMECDGLVIKIQKDSCIIN